VKEQCPYKGNHPAPEAAGYDVTFSCNVPDAKLMIDGKQSITPNGTCFLKTGEHEVRLNAAGYKDLTQKITVSSKFKSFSFIMTKEETVPANTTGFTSSSTLSSNIPAAIQQIESDMVFVEGGTFMMGDKRLYGDPHQVNLSSFYICNHEVTQLEWESLMGKSNKTKNGPDFPVKGVSWDECQIFIGKLNSITGMSYRLPTEAEWEFAARGGNKSHGYKYSGSPKVNKVAWCEDAGLHPVKKKEPNELGIYDMSGNVLEWCNDWYSYDYYRESPKVNPIGPAKGPLHVYRGGGYSNTKEWCSVYFRGWKYDSSTNVFPWSGFRLAKDP